MQKKTQAQRLSSMYDGSKQTSNRVEWLARSLAVRRERVGDEFEYYFRDGSVLDWRGCARSAPDQVVATRDERAEDSEQQQVRKTRERQME